MHFGDFGFGSLRVGKDTYEHDLIIDRGKIRKRKKKPSRRRNFARSLGTRLYPSEKRSRGNASGSLSGLGRMAGCQ